MYEQLFNIRDHQRLKTELTFENEISERWKIKVTHA